MKNKKVIGATVQGLRWAAEALERGDIECIAISHEDVLREGGFDGLQDTGIRIFTIKYKYLNDEVGVLKDD